METLNTEAPFFLERNSSSTYTPKMISEGFSVGDEVLIYLHPFDFNVFNNFWLVWNRSVHSLLKIFNHYLKSNTTWNIKILRLTLEGCKVCKGKDCTSDSIEIIENACSDDTQLSTFVSSPISTSPDTNAFINAINSDYSYQLFQMNLFQFPNTAESKNCWNDNFKF